MNAAIPAPLEAIFQPNEKYCDTENMSHMLYDDKEHVGDCGNPAYRQICGTDQETDRMYAACRDWEQHCQGQEYKSIDTTQIKQSVNEPEDTTAPPDDTPKDTTPTTMTPDGSGDPHSPAWVPWVVVASILVFIIIAVVVVVFVRKNQVLKSQIQDVQGGYEAMGQ